MKFGSLFTGVGGFDLGFERAGMECAWQVEQDKYCNEVLERHWPNTERYLDVREVGKHNLEPVELICGGFPCTDLSIAGKRAGLDGERSGLWFEFERIIVEQKPDWVVIENVPGLLSSNNGEDFAIILRALAECGYGVAYRIFDSQYFGVPQRRRRVFIVASFGNLRAGKVLFESEGVSGHIEKGKEEWEGTATIFKIRSGKPGGGEGYLGNKEHSYALTGLQDQNVMVMASGQANAEIGRERSPALTASHEQPILWEMLHADEAVRESGDVSPTLQKRMGTGGNQVPLVGVRRLTPTECCRLQGFPDNWNDNVSDTQRYKQMGNAITTNVAQWMGKRIVENSLP